MRDSRVVDPRRLLLAAAVLVVSSLAACGSEDSPASSDMRSSIVVEDAWVRASEGPMTGTFATIRNSVDAVDADGLRVILVRTRRLPG